MKSYSYVLLAVMAVGVLLAGCHDFDRLFNAIYLLVALAPLAAMAIGMIAGAWKD